MQEGTVDRRTRKKAQTRRDVRESAQRLFAERGFDAVTIAEIAAAADVAVQTVFNHFSTKEELYFADRTAWVDGPAHAVGARRPGAGAVATVESWMSHQVMACRTLGDWAEARRYLEVLQASAALRVHERELLGRCERQLSDALRTTWAQQLGEEVPGLRLPADLISGVLMAAGRVLAAEHRRLALGPEPSESERAELGALTTGSLGAVGRGIQLVACRPDSPRALQLVAALEDDLPADEEVARRLLTPTPERA